MPTDNGVFRASRRSTGATRNSGTRAVHEYLQALEQNGQVGATPMNISLTDPAARWTAAPGGPAFYAYSTNYLIDVHAGVIVDVEATAAHRTEETDATKTMIDRVEERFDLKPKRLIGDTAYGPRPCSAGWWTRSRSSRTSRCGTRPNARTYELDLRDLGFDGAEPEATGRPAYRPATLLKIYIYGYLNRIQSSRRLERETQRNVELIWLTDRLAPDFKTIADFRRDNGKAIRGSAGSLWSCAEALKLFSDALVAIDGSKFKAVNGRDRNFTKHKLKARMQQFEESIARDLAALDRADRDPSTVIREGESPSPTFHLINETTLRRMKPTAMIINTSRGPVVDENALARALKEHWIAAAALDVFEKEPLPPDSPLRDPAIADRCRLTPHFASAAKITRLSSDPDKGMAGRCVQGLIDVLEGNYGGDITKMPYVVNKEAFEK